MRWAAPASGCSQMLKRYLNSSNSNKVEKYAYFHDIEASSWPNKHRFLCAPYCDTSKNFNSWSFQEGFSLAPVCFVEWLLPFYQHFQTLALSVKIFKKLSIRPLTLTHPDPGRGGSILSRGSDSQPLPGHLLQRFRRNTRTFPYQRCDVLGLPHGLLLVGHARYTSPGRRPGGILTRCPSHLNWLLSTWRGAKSWAYL